jgi:hypothetical protein
MRRSSTTLQRGCLAVAILVLVLPLAGEANEGFWPFNRVPRAAIKQALGVDLSDAWLQRVQQASVRFPNGSGAFVSPDGLVLTNHHVSLQVLQELSTADRDLVAKGFLAKDRIQELRAPDLELLSLQRIEEVTAQVNAAVKPAMSSAETLAARRSAIAAIEKDAEGADGLRAEVVTLYQGGQYHLYHYKKFTDVRLVFAPEFDAAFYGGDPDNFTFPRYCLDMTLFRVYENGRPLAVTNYLPWSTTGAEPGEAVFTSGHPGATQRLNTVAHLEVLRDSGLPLSLEVYGRMRDALVAYGRQGAEEERQAKDLRFSIENALKSWTGQLQGLRSDALMKKKATAEQKLRAAVAASPELTARYADAWDRVEAARRALSSYSLERVFFESGLGFYSDYFTYARSLVRWAAESQKPNGQRLPEFTDARKPQLERQLASTAPVYPKLEIARLTASMTALVDKLGATHPLVQQALAGKAPRARAEELVGATKLGDASVRKALFEGGPSAVDGSADSFVALVRLLEPRARELRTRYDNEVTGVERDAYARIAQAVFAVEGDRAYPDGTFTLRLSYGRVQGFREAGRDVAPFTEVRGLFIRGDEKGMKPPYKIADSWMKARGSLKPTTPYNLVTTNDIVGGNSGSPLINARGELVGLIFDGNIQSLPGYFVYEGDVNRAVSVDVRGMREALEKVYEADALVAELAGAGAAAGKRP